MDSVLATFDTETQACTLLNNEAIVKHSKLVPFNYVYYYCIMGLRYKENITHTRWKGFYLSNIDCLDKTHKKFRRKSLLHFQIGGKR